MYKQQQQKKNGQTKPQDNWCKQHSTDKNTLRNSHTYNEKRRGNKKRKKKKGPKKKTAIKPIGEPVCENEY